MSSEKEKETTGGSKTVEEVLKGTEFLLKFDLQYSNRSTSATPSQLDKIKTKLKIAYASKLPLSSLRPCVPEM